MKQKYVLFEPARNRAERAAAAVRAHLNLSSEPDVGILLGGWWDVFDDFDREMPYEEVPGLEALASIPKLEDHRRLLAIGEIGGKQVVALRGRVHLYDSEDYNSMLKMVRLQVETLIHLGVKTLVLTSGAASLRGGVNESTVVAVNRINTILAQRPPAWGSESANADDALHRELVQVALECGRKSDLMIREGSYLMTTGPHYNSPRDKMSMGGMFHCHVAGWNFLPEVLTAALNNVPTLALAFVSERAGETTTMQDKRTLSRDRAKDLKSYLSKIIAQLP